MKKLKAVLIGAGSIGGNKPDNIENEQTGILSHGHAISRFCAPLQIIDVDAGRAEYVGKKWGFQKIETDIGNIYRDADLYVIAVPTDKHYAVVDVLRQKAILQCDIRVLLEKPATYCGGGAAKLAEMFSFYGPRCFINYQRNYLYAYQPEFLEAHIGSRDTWTVVLHYCRGFVRDASHFFALLHLWGIDPRPLVQFGGIADYSRDDLTRDAVGNRVHLVAHDGRVADVFQVEVCGEYGRAVYSDHGKTLSLYQHQREKTFGEYMSWSEEVVTACGTGLDSGLEVVYSKITAEKPTGVTIYDAVEIWKMMEGVKA